MSLVKIILKNAGMVPFSYIVVFLVFMEFYSMSVVGMSGECDDSDWVVDDDVEEDSADCGDRMFISYRSKSWFAGSNVISCSAKSSISKSVDKDDSDSAEGQEDDGETDDKSVIQVVGSFCENQSSFFV